MDVGSFADIAEELQARVARIAWATVATVGRDGAPRTRIQEAQESVAAIEQLRSQAVPPPEGKQGRPDFAVLP